MPNRLPPSFLGARAGTKTEILRPCLRANSDDAAAAEAIPGDPEAAAAAVLRGTELTAVTKQWIRNVYGAWLRIESPITRGFPDLIGTNGARVAFVECKYLHSTPRGKTALGCKKNQLAFLSTWPNAWLFVRIKDEYALINGTFLRPDLMDYEILLQNATMRSPARSVDWELIGWEIWS